MDGFRSTLSLFTDCLAGYRGAVVPERNSVGGSPGRRYDKHRLTILGFMCRLHC